MALSWKPVRRGAIYCSPACGADCTFAAYEQAKANAAKLAIHLNVQHSPGWKGKVWENMGWHYEAVKGCCTVKRHGTARYTAYFNATPQRIGEGITGKSAVNDALRQWRTFARHVAKVSAEWGQP